MAESIRQRLSGLILSAADLRELTNWPGSLIEDYLNILDNLIEISESVDIGVDIDIQTVSNNYTTSQNDGTILVNASANPVTIYLDATAATGQNHTIKCIDDTFTVLISPNGNNLDTDTDDFEIFQDESVTVRADSSNNWWIT